MDCLVFNLEKQTVSPVETGEKLYGLGMLARKWWKKVKKMTKLDKLIQELAPMG